MRLAISSPSTPSGPGLPSAWRGATDDRHLPAPLRARNKWRALVVVMLLSLVLRLAVWEFVARAAVPPWADEGLYLSRAVAYGEIFRSYASAAVIPDRVFHRAYREGVWAPLNSILIGLGFSIFGPSLALARLIVVLQSVATTYVVYVLTARLASRRAALVAATVHAVYPSFIAYSHLLMSETTFILVWLTTLYCTIRIPAEQRWRAQLFYAVGAGTFLGLAGLTRAAIPPLACVIVAWVLLRVRPLRRGLAAAALVLVVAIVVVSPWLATLRSREHRFVPLSTSGGVNLWEGNNPHKWDDHPWQHRIAVMADAEAYGRAHGLSRDEAARTLALEYIRSDLWGFWRRMIQRIPAFWRPDDGIMYRGLMAIYPPLPFWVVVAMWAIVVAALVGFVAAAVTGLCAPRSALRRRGLLLAGVCGGLMPYIVTHGESRAGVPALATMLPLAGVGLSGLMPGTMSRRNVAWFACTLLLMTVISVVSPQWAIPVFEPVSSFYVPLVRAVQPLRHAKSRFARDFLFFRRGPGAPRGTVHLEVVDGAYQLQVRSVDTKEEEPPSVQSVEWGDDDRSPVIEVYLWTAVPDVGSPAIRIVVPAVGAAAIVQPIVRDSWRSWRPTGIDGIDYAWSGPTSPSLADAQAFLSATPPVKSKSGMSSHD